MTPVGMNSATKPISAQPNSTQAPSQPVKNPEEGTEKAAQQEKSGLVLTEEGKALLAALSEIDKEAKSEESSVKSFTYGALGMEHPDKIEEKDDSSYTAGSYLKGAATIGALLLAIV
ncbi:hypothetical protein [Vibrio hannami]|uniref:hypothetical protein n=1 Tax=Vibrio hannami TaxID=2717094 RepID=UPI0030CA3A38